MASAWTAQTLEQMRRWAVLWLEEGDRQEDVAEALQVSTRTIQRWWRSWQQEGEQGLALKAGRGRPSKLTASQARQIVSWVD